MIFNRKKKKLNQSVERYLEKVISFSQPIDLTTIKFLNPVTHNIEYMFPTDLTEDWNGKLVICDVKVNSVATKMFWNDETLDVIVALSFDTMHIFIRNTMCHEDENRIISINARKLRNFKVMVEKNDYIDIAIGIGKDKMQWFDKARFNAFIKAAGDIDFPVV